MFGMRRLRIGFRVEKRNDNHVKVRGVLAQHVYKGEIATHDYEDHVWLFITILERDEQQLYRDVEVMKMLGVGIQG